MFICSWLAIFFCSIPLTFHLDIWKSHIQRQNCDFLFSPKLLNEYWGNGYFCLLSHTIRKSRGFSLQNISGNHSFCWSLLLLLQSNQTSSVARFIAIPSCLWGGWVQAKILSVKLSHRQSQRLCLASLLVESCLPHTRLCVQTVYITL